MGINKRIETVEFAEGDDNVSTTEDRANDSRGVFDPKDNPFKGSRVGSFGDTVPKISRTLRAIGAVAAAEHKTPLPTEMPVKELLAITRAARNPDAIEIRYRERIKSPLSGIRAMCVTECCNGAVRSVNNCAAVSCPLWPFRMGTNGMRGVK